MKNSWMWTIGALILGMVGCTAAQEPIPVKQGAPVEDQVHVYIAHGREITETFRALQWEIDDERMKNGEPAVLVKRDEATTMNVEDARRRIANGTLRLRWQIPGEATISSGIVWSVPVVPRK